MKEEEALVKHVGATLEHHDLVGSLVKSVFNVDRVEFLGYIMGRNRVTIGIKMIRGILNWKAE